MGDAPTPDAATPRGGGPLRAIASDESRSHAERACASSLIDFLVQQRRMHARQLDIAPGVSLSFAQLKLLFHLPEEGTLTAGRFADAIGITPASLTQGLGPLVDQGLVTRTRSDVDRRVVEVAMTDHGRATLRTLRTTFTQRWDNAIAEIDESQLAAAADVLERLAQVFVLSEPAQG